jgi:hypothetical protein
MLRVRGAGVGVRVFVLSGVGVDELKVEEGITVLVTLGEGWINGEGLAHAFSATKITRSKPDPLMQR